MTNPKARLFVALWPNARVRHALGTLQQGLAPSVRTAGARMVPASNLHLTLAFLGEQPASLALPLAALLAQWPWQPVVLRIEQLDWFEGARILWAGPSGVDPGLERMRQEVLSIVAGLGMSCRPDDPFVPHISLARHVPHAILTGATQTLEWHTGAPCLIRSERAQDGSAYSIVDGQRGL